MEAVVFRKTFPGSRFPTPLPKKNYEKIYAPPLVGVGLGERSDWIKSKIEPL